MCVSPSVQDLVCVCACLQVIALSAGDSWLCCFEVRQLLSDTQRVEQVLEPPDSSAQDGLFAFIAVLNDQTIKTHTVPNKVKVKNNTCVSAFLSVN